MLQFRFLMRTTSKQSVFTDWGNTPTECKDQNELLAPVKEIDDIRLRGMRVKQ